MYSYDMIILDDSVPLSQRTKKHMIYGNIKKEAGSSQAAECWVKPN